ncbi:MAG: helix-turn-helix domain-containing protein, partial [Clostridia bacterium]|nr:helix-turn-helix domain-containing protein [Clostridia bacterium]
KIFGIRFYAWSVSAFSSVDLSGTLNCFIPAEMVFADFNKVAQEVINANSMTERIENVQAYLLAKLQSSKVNSDVMNSIYKIIVQSANIDVKDLARCSAISKRTLEREFRNYTGLSPKEAIELIRYQLLWQECIKPNFNILDCVERLGYYDMAHLYNDFKKFHGISLPQALKLF